MKAQIRLALLVCCFTHFAPIQSAFSWGAKAPKTKIPEAPDVSEYLINGDTLRERLLSNSTAVIYSANALRSSKNSVQLARANLLPSLQLGAVLSSLSAPSFLLSSVQALLPFLVPERWFNYSKSKYMLQADLSAYYLVELNTYASAYALYMTVLNDQALLLEFEQDLVDWREIEALALQRFQWGIADQNELSLAQSRRALSALRVDRIRTLLLSEYSALRNALNLKPSTELKLEAAIVPESPLEQMSFDQALDKIFEVAPEFSQISSLINAAKKDRWGKVFSFVSTPTLGNSSSSGSNVSVAFDDSKGGAGASIGFDYPVRISMGQRNIDQLRIREDELRRELTYLLDTLQKQGSLLQSRLSLAREAETSLRENFAAQLDRYKWGEGTSFIDVLLSRLGILEAVTERIGAQSDQNLFRINLHRLLISGEFTDIKPCQNPRFGNKNYTPDCQ